MCVGLYKRSENDRVSQALEKQYPPNDFPINIDVCGDMGTTSVTIHVWNQDSRLNLWGTAHPEDFTLNHQDGETFTAVMSKVSEMVNSRATLDAMVRLSLLGR